ncbi:MAG: hypothetical protein ABIC91_03845 [Nanoarchaeota archaeon]|nr:hypothetical protein [Nanoarchaeota archaeon]MBU1030435.1 hypothetical protein [Nanoarchaeota archaeon]MBU1849782.1 hypothetical protein [Nanoarchaeota archaeon]
MIQRKPLEILEDYAKRCKTFEIKIFDGSFEGMKSELDSLELSELVEFEDVSKDFTSRINNLLFKSVISKYKNALFYAAKNIANDYLKPCEGSTSKFSGFVLLYNIIIDLSPLELPQNKIFSEIPDKLKRIVNTSDLKCLILNYNKTLDNYRLP